MVQKSVDFNDAKRTAEAGASAGSPRQADEPGACGPQRAGWPEDPSRPPERGAPLHTWVISSAKGTERESKSDEFYDISSVGA